MVPRRRPSRWAWSPAACDGVQVAADAAVKVGYGDGDWGDDRPGALRRRSAGPASGGAQARRRWRRNPAALARPDPDRATPAALRHRATAPASGLAEELRHAGRAEAEPDAPRLPRHAVAGLADRDGALGRRAGGGPRTVLLRNKWLDDLALVTGDPARSRTMFVTGLGAEATASRSGAGRRRARRAPRARGGRGDAGPRRRRRRAVPTRIPARVPVPLTGCASACRATRVRDERWVCRALDAPRRSLRPGHECQRQAPARWPATLLRGGVPRVKTWRTAPLPFASAGDPPRVPHRLRRWRR